MNEDFDTVQRTANYKLKYFCQVCNRQCQDKDGFTCHLKSETHRINMEIVSNNPEQFITKYSYEFESGFLDILKRCYNQIFVSANKVYQEYIIDKQATHLNATKWTTLTEFIDYLKRKGKIEVKVKDKDTLIKFIDISPSEKLKKEKKEREISIEEKKKFIEMKKIMQMAELNKEKSRKEQIGINNGKEEFNNSDTSNLINTNKNEKIAIEINIKGGNHLKSNFVEKIEEKSKSNFLNRKRNKSPQSPSKNEKEENDNEILKENNSNNTNFDIINNPWISIGLIVRIKDKSLNYFNKKGKILNIENDFIAEVLLQNEEIKLKIDQALIEPVIPQIGGQVNILFGEHKNKNAILKSINTKDKTADVEVDENILNCSIKAICKI